MCAQSTAIRITNIVRIIETNLQTYPLASPFIPMCIFTTLKFLVAGRNHRPPAMMDEIIGLKNALTRLGTIFPVASIILENKD
jgi:hypothetical protein